MEAQATRVVLRAWCRIAALLFVGVAPALALAAPALPPQPALTFIFPAGGRRGSVVEVAAGGKNLAHVLSARICGSGVKSELLPPPAGQPPDANTVRLRLTLAPDAELGERDLRFVTTEGVTNRVRFVVDDLPEIVEAEPNSELSQPQRVASLPVIINGQVNTVGDFDNFRVTAQAGQTLTFDVCGQRLAPCIATINPGWFETCLTLYDAAGRTLQFDDDDGFRPDARITYTFADSGDYVIQLRDLLYRSHPQFVYRLRIEAAVDQRPTTNDELTAVNPGNEGQGSSSGETARLLPAIPAEVAGRIERGGQTLCLAFTVPSGERRVFDVYARRGGSPLDPVLELLDEQGRILSANDDAAGEGADAHIEYTFPAAGRYTVRLRDAVGHGGREYTYRLSVRPPRPDFALSVTPDNPRVAPGQPAALTVTVNRREGFAGAVTLAVGGLPAGITASAVTIPADQKQARLTLTAEATASPGVAELTITGTATLNGQPLARDATGMESVGYVDQQRQLPVREVLLEILGKAE